MSLPISHKKMYSISQRVMDMVESGESVAMVLNFVNNNRSYIDPTYKNVILAIGYLHKEYGQLCIRLIELIKENGYDNYPTSYNLNNSTFFINLILCRNMSVVKKYMDLEKLYPNVYVLKLPTIVDNHIIRTIGVTALNQLIILDKQGDCVLRVLDLGVKDPVKYYYSPGCLFGNNLNALNICVRRLYSSERENREMKKTLVFIAYKLVKNAIDFQDKLNFDVDHKNMEGIPPIYDLFRYLLNEGDDNDFMYTLLRWYSLNWKDNYVNTMHMIYELMCPNITRPDVKTLMERITADDLFPYVDVFEECNENYPLSASAKVINSQLPKGMIVNDSKYNKIALPVARRLNTNQTWMVTDPDTPEMTVEGQDTNKPREEGEIIDYAPTAELIREPEYALFNVSDPDEPGEYMAEKDPNNMYDRIPVNGRVPVTRARRFAPSGGRKSNKRRKNSKKRVKKSHKRRHPSRTIRRNIRRKK